MQDELKKTTSKPLTLAVNDIKQGQTKSKFTGRRLLLGKTMLAYREERTIFMALKCEN